MDMQDSGVGERGGGGRIEQLAAGHNDIKNREEQNRDGFPGLPSYYRQLVPNHCSEPFPSLLYHKTSSHTLTTTIFFPSHTAWCHPFTSGLTRRSTELGKHPEVVKIGARDISQPSEHAQSVFSSLTLQPGQRVYLMAKTLSRAHHNSDCVGAFVQTCQTVCTQAQYTHTPSYINVQTAAHILKSDTRSWHQRARWQLKALRGLMSEMD